MNIRDLQQWVKEDWEKHSPASPSIDQQILYLIEELGEVAEAIRKTNGAKNRVTKEVDIGSEMADLMVSLVTLANSYNIDLEQEIQEFKKRLLERHNRGF